MSPLNDAEIAARVRMLTGAATLAMLPDSAPVTFTQRPSGTAVRVAGSSAVRGVALDRVERAARYLGLEASRRGSGIMLRAAR